MTILLILFGASGLLELLPHMFGAMPRFRVVLASFSLLFTGFVAGALLAAEINLFSAVVALLCGYRIFNMMRVVEKRMHSMYLRRATLRSSAKLVGLQMLVFIFWWMWQEWHATGHLAWGVLGCMQLVVAAVLLYSTARTLKRTTWHPKLHAYSDKELPTVTVAIPARNETEDLQQCLQSVLASDYPKLEIIVLDDCSQLKRTPEIIKDFAHDGVRFIQGEEPKETWLPKNQAYDRLLQEATGMYILFCGVDIRFQPTSIREVVSFMLSRDKKMLSLLPLRVSRGRFTLIQALRYWWELALPRRLFNRPPVLSSCWIIEHESLRNSGGFAAVARSIVPEAHFARQLVAADAYSFMRSDASLGIESTKQVNDQWDTAIRMRYPQLHRRPEQVAAVTLLEIVFLLMPFVLAISGFWISIGIAGHFAAILASVLLVITYELIVLHTRIDGIWPGLTSLLFAVLMDLVLLHYSMWKYEFSVVDWKGRNVCIPVMHVVPRLPK